MPKIDLNYRKRHNDHFGVIFWEDGLEGVEPYLKYFDNQAIYLPRFVFGKNTITQKDLDFFPELVTDGYQLGESLLWEFDAEHQLWEKYPHVFRVNEWGSGFELEHVRTGMTQWLSDGVDALWFDEAEIDCPCHSTNKNCVICRGKGSIKTRTIRPGNRCFRPFWEYVFNTDIDNTLDVYFPEVRYDEYTSST